MKKRKRGRPSGAYEEGPDGQVFAPYEELHYKYRDVIEYVEDHPKTFRRRRTRSGRRVKFAETRTEYIERLIPAVQALSENVYGPPPPRDRARAIIKASVPPSTRGDVNKKDLAYRILRYYNGGTLKVIRDRVKKGKRRPLTPAQVEKFIEELNKAEK